MKSSPRSSKKKIAFTLIELLVVITIIGILVSLLFPAFAAVKQQAYKTLAKNDETQITAAVKNYYTEYGKYPVSLSSGTTSPDAYFGKMSAGSTYVSATNDVLFDVLRYNTASTTKASDGTSNLVTTMNPRAIVFLDVPMVKSTSQPSQGIVPSTAAANKGAWYDPWGSQYNILIDYNYDTVINCPYASSAGFGGQDPNPPGGTQITSGVIVWSLGKNGALGGGAAASGSFSSESGKAGIYAGSLDVLSWQ